jgi:hypothetical protein
MDADLETEIRRELSARACDYAFFKTGNIPGVLHDWGYTGDADLFLLAQNVRNEGEGYDMLSRLGPKLLLPHP